MLPDSEFNSEDIARYLCNLCRELFPNHQFVAVKDEIGRWEVVEGFGEGTDSSVTRGRNRWVASFLLAEFDRCEGWFFRLNRGNGNAYDIVRFDLEDENTICDQLACGVYHVLKGVKLESIVRDS